jgi:SAM-dependent methyltransferase
MFQCAIEKDQKVLDLYSVKNLPLFQNKVYKTRAEALESPVGNVTLSICEKTGCVINRSFDSNLMSYDQNYNNEQNYSPAFQSHLKAIYQIISEADLLKNKVVEIGCGKGYFLDLLLSNNVDAFGVDPTFEGNNPRVRKEYFTEKSLNGIADLLILRHTLEHIPNPFAFIHEIAKANQYQGKIFIEVPTFDWIMEKNAFWDVFYEHCNYFTEDSLASFFSKSISGRVFNGQYIYMIADLKDLKPADSKLNLNPDISSCDQLKSTVESWKSFVKHNPNTAIWGAAGKGSTFLNTIDPTAEFVDYVIDINPFKQNRFIAKTGHQIFSPEILKERKIENIIIMNENYLDEIRNDLNGLAVHLHCL